MIPHKSSGSSDASHGNDETNISFKRKIIILYIGL